MDRPESLTDSNSRPLDTVPLIDPHNDDDVQADNNQQSVLLIESDPSHSPLDPHLHIPERSRMPAPGAWSTYLLPEELRGFKRYKYSAVDTSPLSNYVMHPFWNALVPYVPRSIAPNTLTLSGFLLIVLNFAVLSYYDYDLTAAGNPAHFIPRWVWWFVAFNHFWAHTLDGLDGKHARRTESSSPLGELFDHGLDSWVTTLHCLCLYSVFGREPEYGIPTVRMFVALWLMLVLFSLSHWEKYNTGILYLPWGYDFSQVVGLIVYIITGIWGQGVWHMKLPVLGISPGVGFELSLYAGAVFLTIPTTLRNMYRAYANKTLKHNSFVEAMRPLSPITILLVVTLLWGVLSPNRILFTDLRAFSWMTGTVCSNITCALIITQMSLTKARWFHWLLVPVILAFTGVMGLSVMVEHELTTVYALTVLVTVAQIHYGFSVVHQMASFLNIYAFSISKPPLHTPRGSLLERIDEDVDNGKTGNRH
ncbi:ethanolaminephosphotransferase 1-like [Paramacrobiotus metropolitanus]|uniref:ethanolaminephosphotransferase 1-like n=1 Tax=Paramacrobiotus metropolitanus TaxID=2943436 RepID=UPI002446117E|nr:ethanolaminephosphotransferase 1-like [Paramacrobiotus metropolitanus]